MIKHKNHTAATGLPGRTGKDTDGNLRFERALDKYLGSPLVHALALFGTPPARTSTPLPGDVRRILLIKFYGIGNIVMMLPAVRALRRRFPDAKITFLTLKSNAGILAGTGESDRLVLLDKSNAWTFIGSALRILPDLRSRSFDLVVDFEQFANISAILSALTGAPFRIGFQNPAHRREKLLTMAVPYLDSAHMSRIFLRLAGAAGAEIGSAAPRRISLAPSDIREAVLFEREAEIGPDDVLVVIHPGSSENLVLRRWPVERFAALANRLVDRHGVRVVLSGSSGELPLVERLAGLMGHRAAVGAGRLSLKGLAALCERAELVISSDTAPVHIASAMGTPVVGLYGPNTPFLYGPTGEDDLVFYREIPCSPCLTNTNRKLSRCTSARCMEEITVDEVTAGIETKYFTPGGALKAAFRKSRGPAAALLEGSGRIP